MSMLTFTNFPFETNISSPAVNEAAKCSYIDATKQSNPKSHHLNILLKNAQARETEEHPY